jgi:hypothetical protein
VKPIGRLEPGDVLVVTRLDRLARSTRDLLNVIAAIADRGAGFKSPRILGLIPRAATVAVCLWIVIHLFMLPRTTEGYRTWVYLGLVVAPLALAAAIAIWSCAPATRSR